MQPEFFVVFFPQGGAGKTPVKDCFCRRDRFPRADGDALACLSEKMFGIIGTSRFLFWLLSSPCRGTWRNEYQCKEDIDPDVTQDFFDGMVAGISPNGRYAAGYFSQAGDYSDAFSFVFDTQSQTLEKIEQWVALSAVLDDGTVFGLDSHFGSGVIRTKDFSGS